MSYFRTIRDECGTETCPTIDRVQGRIREALSILASVDEDEDGRLSEAAHALHGEAEVLESVRTTCERLRNALADRMERIDDLERELAACQKEHGEAVSDRDDWRNEYNELRKQIDAIDEAARIERVYGSNRSNA